MRPHPAIAALLSRQDGLITLAQATGHGMAERTVQRRVRTGEWERLCHRVYLVAGHPLSDAARVRAAGLWAGERAAVSGPAAAWWHGGLSRCPAEVEVTVPRRLGLRPQPGIRVRRRDLAAPDLLGVGGIWLTDTPLTALETAIAVPDGSAFLDRTLQKRVTFRRIYAAYCRNLGARGFGRVAVLLAAAADRADSAAERLMLRILRSANIVGWAHDHRFGPYRIDFAFPAQLVAVEVDGWAWHMDVDRRGGRDPSRPGARHPLRVSMITAATREPPVLACRRANR